MTLLNCIKDICRINLNGVIVNSKRKCYRQKCADVDENPWGSGYKMVMRKLNCFRPPATTYAAKLKSINMVNGENPRSELAGIGHYNPSVRITA